MNSSGAGLPIGVTNSSRGVDSSEWSHAGERPANRNRANQEMMLDSNEESGLQQGVCANFDQQTSFRDQEMHTWANVFLIWGYRY